MAKSTRGKRTANRAAMKSAPAGRRKMQAKSGGTFPGGAKKTKGEVKRMVPRMTRQTSP